MVISKAELNDIKDIMKIYKHARNFMVQTGNPTQWVDGYPSISLIEQDIHQGNLYVCTDQDKIEAVFALIYGEDPTYARIYDGAWKNQLPYATLHRIASIGQGKGTASFCISWCLEQCKNLRVDTHPDNKIMQHLIEKNGFDRCGIIYVKDGSPRIAYQKIIDFKGAH